MWRIKLRYKGETCAGLGQKRRESCNLCGDEVENDSNFLYYGNSGGFIFSGDYAADGA